MWKVDGWCISLGLWTCVAPLHHDLPILGDTLLGCPSFLLSHDHVDDGGDGENGCEVDALEHGNSNDDGGVCDLHYPLLQKKIYDKANETNTRILLNML